MVEIDKIPVQVEYEEAFEDSIDLNKKIVESNKHQLMRNQSFFVFHDQTVHILC